MSSARSDTVENPYQIQESELTYQQKSATGHTALFIPHSIKIS